MAAWNRLAEMVRRGLRTHPRATLRWLARQRRARQDRAVSPARVSVLAGQGLYRRLGIADSAALRAALDAAPWPLVRGRVDPAALGRVAPGEYERIMAAAKDALAHRVDLLGSGPVDLGETIDWHRDFKSGHVWPRTPWRRIDVHTAGTGADVKVPWELSRLQWLLPAGQAYLLTGDERHAEGARAVIASWLAENPLGEGVNWACPMDAALRALALCWFAQVFRRAAAWDDTFLEEVVRSVWLHGDFVERHLEWADVNGNHLLADALGLVAAGTLFGGTDDGDAARWRQRGWRILEDEIVRQVHPDGVGFEASAAYHRLAAELFALGALFRAEAGGAIGARYAGRLAGMARFVAASKPDGGEAPLWGDDDNGRVLPLGGQRHGDHRYLVGLIDALLPDAGLHGLVGGPRGEAVWLLGPKRASHLPEGASAAPGGARPFTDAGVFVMRGGGDHVFVDAGPVGFAGRGGHGHNDCLSFEAAMAGTKWVTDAGTYVYTADPRWRNRLRGTAAHNTPMIGDAEQNRFVSPDYLWTLHDDAKPRVRVWRPAAGRTLLVASHTGYARLRPPAEPVRAFLHDSVRCALCVVDRIDGAAGRPVTVPWHLAPGVAAKEEGGAFRLTAGEASCRLVWQGAADGWRAETEAAWCSPAYGEKVETTAVVFRADKPTGPLAAALVAATMPDAEARAWLDETAREARAAMDERPVTVLVNGLHAKSGGGVTYLVNILPLLARMPDLDVVACLHEDQSALAARLEDAGVRVRRLGFRSGFWRLLVHEQRAVPGLARETGADVVFSPANYGPLRARNAVIMLRNALGVGFVERRPAKIAYWLLLYLATAASLMTCRRAVAVSRFAAGAASGGLHALVKRRVAIIPHGVNPLFRQAGESEAAVDGPTILAVSDLYVQKNLANLIRAFARLRADRPGLRLRIAGRPVDAAYAASLEALVHAEELDDAVDFLGHVEADRLAALYRAATVFVFPSTVETFGNPLAEAMASGCAIATSDAAAMPEVAGDGALYFDPADPADMAAVVGRLLDDAALRTDVAAKARARAERYSWEATAAETARVLAEAAGRTLENPAPRD